MRRSNTKNSSWFLRMFYCLAAVPMAFVLELCLKSSAAVLFTAGILMVSVTLSIIFYSWAMFKAFHYPIFRAAGDTWGERMAGQGSPENLNFVLKKLAEAVLWLAALLLVFGAIAFLQLCILKTMPQAIMQEEVIQQGSCFIKETFGSGIYLAFSAASLFLQAIVLISITYVSAAAAHFSFFERYRTLAGIFIFVLLYVFENDVSAALKKIMAQCFGGIQNLMLQSPRQAMGMLTGIEAAACGVMLLINILLIGYCLKKLERGEQLGEGEKEEKI